MLDILYLITWDVNTHPGLDHLCQFVLSFPSPVPFLVHFLLYPYSEISTILPRQQKATAFGRG
jgi:hypothetical protein